MTTLVARHNAPHDEVLRQLAKAGLLDRVLSCGEHREGWWGHTRPGFLERVEEHAALGLAVELPVRPWLHAELLPARDFRYGTGVWGEGYLQVIVFDGGRQWYADIDRHAPVDVAGAIAHAIDVIDEKGRP